MSAVARYCSPLRLALVSLIVALGIVFYLAASSAAEDLLHQSLQKRAEEKARIVSVALENLISAQNRHLLISACLTANRNSLGKALVRGDVEGARPIVKNVLDRSLHDSDIAFLELYDRNQRLVYRTNEKDEPTDPSVSWGAYEALSGRSVVSGAQEMGLLTLRASEPVYFGKEIIGVVTAGQRITPEFLKTITHNLEAGVTLLSREGKVLASNEDDLGQVDIQAINDAFGQKIPVYRHDATLRQTRGYFPVMLVDSAYILVVDTQNEAAYLQLAQASQHASHVFLATVVACVLISLLLLLWILRPMVGLRQRAEAMALELTGSQITPDSRCDVSSIVGVLDGVSKRLASRNAELADAVAKSEAANRAKTQFLANMSHEVRTPMNAILGMSQILARHTDDPALRDKLGVIRHAADQLMQMLNNILDLSRLDAHQLQIDQTTFTLAALMRHLENLVSRRAKAKGLQLIFDIEPGLAQRLLVGDALRLQQTLVNLAGNAIKFTSQGSVTVAVEVVEASGSDLRLRFRVSDTGIGIPPHLLKGIFVPFEQVDGSMTRQFGGAGLGLTISQRFVQLMGGNIEVSSTQGVGSAFEFTLTFTMAAAQDGVGQDVMSGAEAEQRLRADFRGTRVLVVDDDPVSKSIVQELLGKMVGFHVDLASDGQQALELAEAQDYALILMDVQMPRMDGLEATRRIRQLPGYVFVPIVAMTANTADNRVDCMAAGMSDFLSKPVVSDLLFVTLAKWLQATIKS